MNLAAMPPAPLTPPAPTGDIRPGAPLSALETAIGTALGRDPVGGDAATSVSNGAAAADRAGSPADALRAVLRRALLEGPCWLSFSGGRDSSALLAVAVDVARRDGLALPIPVTLRFAAGGAAEESSWQELVLAHLGLRERLVLDVRDELDVVGPVAAAALARHGLTWPVNSYLHVPMFAAAGGGTFVTGFGGDELGRASQHAYAGQVLARRRRPRPPDLAILGLAASPSSVRRAVHRHRARAQLADFTWLRESARSAAADLFARDDAAMPVRFDHQLDTHFRRHRYFTVTRRNFDVLAAAYRTRVVHPFVEDDVLAAVGRAGGTGGFGSRTAMLTQLFGDLLPRPTLTRRSKALFDSPLWTATAAAFAQQWSGGGVDPGLVDPDALRATWADPGGNTRSWFLLQAAWRHDHPSG